MRRVLSVLVLAAFVGVAVADIPPPPPPKGKKYVSVSNEVVLGKDVSGYVFVKQVNMIPGGGKTYSKVELTSKPTAIPEPARRTYVTLFAVPQDAAKDFKTDKDLFDAVGRQKGEGRFLHRLHQHRHRLRHREGRFGEMDDHHHRDRRQGYQDEG